MPHNHCLASIHISTCCMELRLQRTSWNRNRTIWRRMRKNSRSFVKPTHIYWPVILATLATALYPSPQTEEEKDRLLLLSNLTQNDHNPMKAIICVTMATMQHYHCGKMSDQGTRILRVSVAMKAIPTTRGYDFKPCPKAAIAQGRCLTKIFHMMRMTMKTTAMMEAGESSAVLDCNHTTNSTHPHIDNLIIVGREHSHA